MMKHKVRKVISLALCMSMMFGMASANVSATDTPKASVCEAVQKTESYPSEVERLGGKDRYETAYQTADALKKTLDVEKFDSAIITTGKKFADALSGSYLASVKQAPILLTNGKKDNVAELLSYIKNNVAENATIYILGGEGAVTAELNNIEGYRVERLEGKDRYDTNLRILEEAGLDSEELLIAAGKDFADSLSASAAGRPILLVKSSGSLNEKQKAIIEAFKTEKLYIIGGEAAVGTDVENEIKMIAEKEDQVERISGNDRYETSVKVAETFFDTPKTAVVAYGKNFPDGLCGGTLAAALNVPLILTKENSTEEAAAYIKKQQITSGYVLGGTAVLSEETVQKIFSKNDHVEDCEHEYVCKICSVEVSGYGALSQKVCGKCGDVKYEAAHDHTLNEVGVCTCCGINILGIMNQAYMYAFPLVLMDVTAEKVTNTETATYTQAPTNQFVHVPAFANASTKDVVLPNVDTLYSQAFLDLSETAVIVELPKTDRFCILQAMDAYSNTIDTIACNELQERTTYIFTGPDFNEEIPEGMIEIQCPTNTVWILGRTVCGDNENNASDGWLITRTIQSQMKMYTLEQYQNGTQDQPLKGEYEEEYDGIVPLNYVIYNLTADEFFNRANELMISNPPAEEDADLIKMFSYIGVGPGCTFDSSKFGTEATTLLYGWIRQNIAKNCVAGSSDFIKYNGVWSYYGDPIGDYGTEYAFRCLIALAGFGANPAEMAIYPSAEKDVTGASLTGENAYVIHLDKEQLALLEKHNGYGFWSITAYGTDQYLIANEMDRYCINDRNAVYNEDGTIDIYVAKEAPEDTEKYPNWLPVGEEGFKLYFRIYLPCEEIINNEWTMPGISRVN